MSFVRRAALRLGGFGSSVVITGVVSLAVIPVIVHFAGDAAWASYAVGQTVGALLGVFVSLGWLQIGPALVARADAPGRARIYLESLLLRGGVLLVAAPVAAVVTGALVREHVGAAVVSALAAVLLASGGAWFFVGAASPTRLIIFDTLPRAAGIVLGAVGVASSGDVLWAAVGTLVGVAVAVGSSAAAVFRENGRPVAPTPADLRATLRRQWHGLGAGVFSAMYLSVPLLFVSYFLPAQTAAYALADRLKQQGMAVATPFGQTLQGWVPKASDGHLAHRVRRCVWYAFVLGALGGMAYLLLGLPVSAVLGAGQVTLDFSLVTPVSIAFGLNIVTFVIGTACLIPVGRVRSVFWSAVGGTLVVAPAMAVGGPLHGAPGIAWAAALSQLTVLVIQCVALAGYFRREGRASERD